MQLSDKQLRELLGDMNVETPPYAPQLFDPDRQIQPASIDLRVDRVHWKWQQNKSEIDLTNKLGASFAARRQGYRSNLGAHGVFSLQPGQMLMGRTLEKFSIPNGYAAQIITRSSFGRLGLSATIAGYINPGYRGHMPLQIENHSVCVIKFAPFVSICQMILVKLSSESDRPYGVKELQSKYIDDQGGPSRWWQDQIVVDALQRFEASNMPKDVEEYFLSLLLHKDVSTLDRFIAFAKKARPDSWTRSMRLWTDLPSASRLVKCSIRHTVLSASRLGFLPLQHWAVSS